MQLRIGSKRWVATLSALTAVAALSIDMSLPAQPTLAATFDVPSETAGLTLSMFLVAFAAAQLVTGTLSDAIGRKRVLMAGLVLFSIGGIACAVAPSIEMLIACRMLQGLGAAAAPVVARAMVRDTQPATEAARLLSTMLAALAVAPMLAPVLGGALLAISWRAIFVTHAIAGALLFALAMLLDETNPPERRVPPRLLKNLGTLVRTPGTRLPMVISCTTFAGQFAFVGASSFILIDGFHVAPSHFAFYFGAAALAIMMSSLAGRALLKRQVSPRLLLRGGTAILALGGVLTFVFVRADLGLAGFISPVVIYFCGVGLVAPSSTALAMEPVPQLAGTASAAIGSLNFVCGAIAGYEVTKLGGHDPHVFSIVLCAMGVLAFVLGIARR
ncbi:MAG: Bcr/CflA family efflux MFS transporter [Kofleriaceae bacterium]